MGFVGSFDELAVDEHRAGAYEGDEMRCVDRALQNPGQLADAITTYTDHTWVRRPTSRIVGRQAEPRSSGPRRRRLSRGHPVDSLVAS